MARISSAFFVTMILVIFLTLSATTLARSVETSTSTTCRRGNEICGGFGAFSCCEEFICVLESDFDGANGVCMPSLRY
ncbi:hypothetical protein BVRB_4g091340 [Beta vulgaris subsp. vulgaris]|nr:hypothetical protein BVRB_4g091340 [Beta vulgaris subsp. vulgaris]